jgi:hypothetical protein
LALAKAPEGPYPIVSGPRLQGATLTWCGETSPQKNRCGPKPFDAEACGDLGCGPQVRGTTGFTGKVTAALKGYDRAGTARWVWESCTLLMGASGSALAEGCTDGSNAPGSCDASGLCTYWLYPPFSLEGEAVPGPYGLGPAGPWQVAVVT